MKGQIVARGEGTWAVILYLGRGPDGKERRKWVTVKGTRKDAEREQRRLTREIDTGAFVAPSRMTVGEYLEQWLANYAKPNTGAKTYEAYRNHIRAQIIPALGAHKLCDLKPLHIQGAYTKWLESGRKKGTGGLSATTVLHYHRILHKAFEQAVKWEILARNYCDAVEPPRPARRKMKVLDEAQTACLLAAAHGTRMYLPVLIAVATGMRRGEVLALRWAAIDLDSGMLSVCESLGQTTGSLHFKPPKNDRGRQIALPSLLVEALRRHKGAQSAQRLLLGPSYQDQGLVIAREDGSPVQPDRFSQDFTNLIRKLDLPCVRLHDLRHSHATQLLKQQIHPKIVSERLGHSSIGITLDTYSHVMPGMQEEAARGFDTALRAAMGTEKAANDR